MPTPTKPVAEIVAELNRLRIAAGEGKLRMSGGGPNADKVSEWVCYLVENSDTMLAELTRSEDMRISLLTRISQFDACIRRIVSALGIGQACAGVDTDSLGGNTAHVIEKYINRHIKTLSEWMLGQGLSTGHGDTLFGLLTELLSQNIPLRSSDAIAELTRLSEENERLKDVLGRLVDNQNGCPLPKYEEDWSRAMRDAGKLLGRKP